MIYSQKFFVTGLLFIIALLPLFLFAQTERDQANVDEPTRTETEIRTSNNTPTPRATTSTPALVPNRALREDRGDTRENIDSRNSTDIQRPEATRMPINMRPTTTIDRLSLEERKAQMEAMRLEMQAKQAERQAALQEQVQKRINHLAATVSDKMEIAIARIYQVIERIESRMAKLQEQGVITTEAERHLAAAKSDLRLASSILTSIDNEIITALTGSEPRNAWAEIRKNYQEAREAIRSAHSSVKNAVEALKFLVRNTQLESATEIEIDTAE